MIVATTVPILLYHSVSADTTPMFRTWAVRPETFAAHMGYLKDHQYTPMTVSQLVDVISGHTANLPDRPVVITFDDGLADFYTGALPILMDHHFTATLYITTGLVGRTSAWLAPLGEGSRPMLTWSQIAEIQANGLECGAHSMSHPQLDVISRTAAREEITHCKSQLEQRLGRMVKTFAYPHGHFSPTVRRLVQEAGYQSAGAVEAALSSTAADPFALARIIVMDSANTDLESFGSLLTGEGLPAPLRGAWLRAWGRRQMRRSAAMFGHWVPSAKGKYANRETDNAATRAAEAASHMAAPDYPTDREVPTG